MSLINDVLRDIDRRQGPRPSLPTGDTPLMVAPPVRNRRWPPSWMLLLGVGLILGATGGHLLYNQYSLREQRADATQEPVNGGAPTPVTGTAVPVTETAAATTPTPLLPPLAESSPSEPTPRDASGPDPVTISVSRMPGEGDTGADEPREPTAAPPPVTLVEAPPAIESQPRTAPVAQPASVAQPLQAVFLPPDTRVNLRAGPGLDQAVLHVLSDRSQLILLEDGEDFRRVRTADGSSGWVSSSFSSLAPYPVPPAFVAPSAAAASAPASTSTTAVANRPAQDSYRNALRALERGDTAAAEAGLRQAMAARPDDQAALDTLAALMLRQNRHAELQTLLSDMHGAGVTHATHLLARLQAEGGDIPGAVMLLSSLPAERLGDAGVSTLAALHQRAGNHAVAAAVFRQALSLGSRSPSTWAGLAISLEALGERASARQAWESALSSGPADAALAEHARRRLAALAATGD